MLGQTSTARAWQRSPEGVRTMPTVLVVDDEPQIVDLLRSYLERDGFTVKHASDGEKAL